MAIIAKAGNNQLLAVAIAEHADINAGATDGLAAVSYTEEIARSTAAYYFPLSSDAEGYMPTQGLGDTTTLTAAIATNLAYDDEGCWVGSAVTNLQPAVVGWTPAPISSAISPYGTSKRELKDASFTTLTADNTFAITPGSYTVSAYYRQAAGVLISPTQFSLVKSTGAAAISRSAEQYSIPSIQTQWQRGWGSANFSETTPAFPYVAWAGAAGQEARFCGSMTERKPFVSAYTPSTRAAGVLAFNLNTSCGLAWNAAYTIYYWKRMHGTADDTLTGLSVDSLGRSTNTLGGGYRWWGKASGANTWGWSGAGASSANLQYRWMLVVLRRTGTTLTLRAYANGALLLSQDVDDSTATTANRYVNQSGFDLQLGGYDSANPSNAYYRDLVVIPAVALTNNEIDKLYATKLKMGTAETLVSSIQEGVI